MLIFGRLIVMILYLYKQKRNTMKKRTLFAIVILSITFIAFVILGIQSVNETKEMVNLTLGLNN